uniref:Poly (ADP-ribose) polymerase family, member 12a n=1 Tax=Lates calcarifer TaxID=8187 RepID=A0A4W6F381_LATCA
MTSLISKSIIKTLCDHQGCLDFKRLDETIAQSFTVAEPVLRSVLFDDGKIAIHAGRERVTGGQILSPDSLVVAKTNLRICQKKAGECQQCDGLHLCKFYVCGDCTFGQKCKNPHSLASPYNAMILKRYSLHDLTEKQLFQLLLQNDPYLLPEICTHYNKGNGEYGSCVFTTKCTKLHVCQHYFQGDCKFGPSCKRPHNIDAQGMKNFRGFSQENIRNLHVTYRNKLIITGQRAIAVPAPLEVRIPPQQPSQQASQKPSHQARKHPSHSNPGSPTSSACPPKPMSDADRNEICLYFIRRHCSFKEKCVRVHWHLPYRWQVLDSDGVTWKDLLDMEDIEKAYCDPGRDTNSMTQPSPTSGFLSFLGFQSSVSLDMEAVDFTTMKYRGFPVRRLSTASSVSKPPHYILTTQWLWYWKDENEKWVEFGQGDTPASITSETLENVYLADRDTDIPFSAGKQQYVLRFKGQPGTQQMYQENLKYKTQREVRRRPRFVSAHDVKTERYLIFCYRHRFYIVPCYSDTAVLEISFPQVTSPVRGLTVCLLCSAPSQSSSSSTAESVPPHWDKNALPDFGYKLVPLSKSVTDFSMIKKLFRRTMPQSKINSIQRIQNPSLWKVFQWQREQMKKRNGGKLVDERYLFHGTDESLIEAICEQNFDWRMCGVHGTAYGKGSYFARDASYSDRYARAKGSLTKIMFVALVLVGEYTRGSSSFVRPPSKDNNRTLYDSCVDSQSNPSIFVVFEKQQIYPEYLIKYS